METSVWVFYCADVTYTITGFADDFGFPNDPSLAPEVSAGESYVAQFLIDDAALDINPDPTVGVFAGAISSGSIQFSGGYSSQVDFSGGTVTIQQDSNGGGVFLSPAVGSGTILIADIGNPFASDQLLTGLGTTIVASPTSLFNLTEPTGFIVSFSQDTNIGGFGPIVLSVTSANAVPEPSSACFLGFGVLACALRRRR